MLFASLAFLLVGMIPFGYTKWKRKREFKRIRNELVELTGGGNFGFTFTYKRYKKNRAGLMVSYAYPILSSLFSIICSILTMPVDTSTQYDVKNIIILISGFALLHSLVILKGFFKRNEELKIALHDVLSNNDLYYMMGKSEALEKNIFLHKLSKNRNENSLLLIRNKEYVKELKNISSIISHARKVEEGLNYVKKSKETFTEKEYELKKEKLTESFKASQEQVQKAIHSTLVAIGNKQTLEQEKQEELNSKKNINELLNEGFPKNEKQVFLPAPILELQEVIENSVDEEVKKEAEEALRIANDYFQKSIEQKESFKKEFARMNQKSIIDTALQEIHKY